MVWNAEQMIRNKKKYSKDTCWLNKLFMLRWRNFNNKILLLLLYTVNKYYTLETPLMIIVNVRLGGFRIILSFTQRLTEIITVMRPRTARETEKITLWNLKGGDDYELWLQTQQSWRWYCWISNVWRRSSKLLFMLGNIIIVGRCTYVPRSKKTSSYYSVQHSTRLNNHIGWL